MRSFEDEWGRTWDVVVGRESWGALFAIFLPNQSADELDPEAGSVEPVLRQIAVDASGYAEAERVLDQTSTEELRAMLARSEPKVIAWDGEP